MTLTVPEWLARRGGDLRLAPDGRSCYVLVAGQPHYLLTPRPAAGRHTCTILQTNNGRRLDRGTVYPSVEEAYRGGLEELRQALGW
ncbi:MAG: hypothetical protein NZ700_04235 [Gemmataceae bacterium]|nr:hypothetical protein [Gemmataceae bacterium]MDW8266612.1 hypothetical protein [Gemmataceae bacterium]